MDRAALGGSLTRNLSGSLSRRTIIAAGSALILVVAAATIGVVLLLRADALRRAERHVEHLATALAEHTRQSVQGIELALAATAADVERALAAGRGLDEALRQRVRDRINALPQVRALLLIDSTGELRLHSREAAAPPVQHGDRDYFKAHAERRLAGLYVGAPIATQRMPERTYTVSRRVEGPSGQFLGVVAVGVELDYFRDFYDALKLGDWGRIFLFRSDGLLLSMYPPLEHAIGRSFAADPVFAAAAPRRAAVERRAGFVDAKARIVAYRSVEGQPLLVAVSATEDFVLADWRRDALHLGAGGAVMAGVIALAMVLGLRQLGRSERLEAELAQAGERLRRIVDTAMDAIITVDGRQRVVMFNAAAERIFRCPASAALGQPLDRFIPERHRAAHREHVRRFGESGETKRAMGARLALSGLRSDGEEFPIDASISQVTHEGEKLYTVILRDITERRRAEEALERSYEELRALSAAMNEVREAERTRIARELHDELAQWLTALKMDVAWLGARLPREARNLAERTERMKGIVDATVSAVRRIAADLRPPMLDDLGLAAAIENLLHEFSQRSGVRVVREVDADAASLGEPLATSFYRILQEALTNVARHAAATEVRVTLTEENDEVVLRVLDNGRGFDPQEAARKRSYGVLGIRERAQTLGGRAHIARAQGGGTLVEVAVPAARYRRREAVA